MRTISCLVFLFCLAFIGVKSSPENDIKTLEEKNVPRSKAMGASKIHDLQNGPFTASDLPELRSAYFSLLRDLNQGQLWEEIQMLKKNNPNPKKTLVGITSVYRERDEYLYKTLSSLLPALFGNNITSSLQNTVGPQPKTNIYLGSPNDGYAKFTKFNSLVNAVPMEEDFWNAPFGYTRCSLSGQEVYPSFKDLSISIRQTHNYVRMIEDLVATIEKEKESISIGPSMEASDKFIPKYGVLLLEDDIIFISDAATRLDATVSAIERTIGEDLDYILTCYLPTCQVGSIGREPLTYSVPITPGRSFSFNRYATTPEQFSRYDISERHPFWGLQCMYMPEKTAKKAAAWMRNNYLSPHGTRPWAPSDYQVSYFASTFNIPIFAMHEPIAQHIGRSTTGLAGVFHQGIGHVQIPV